jgi:signal transduction histidine kinase
VNGERSAAEKVTICHGGLRELSSEGGDSVLESLLGGVAEPVIAADSALRVEYLNPPAERILGLTRREASGAPLDELIPMTRGGAAGWSPAGWNVQRRSDGGWNLFGRSLAEMSESLPGIQQLIETEQLAAVGQVAAGVAHEIGAPLTAISVAVEYLLKTELGAAGPHRKDLEMILSQTQRITRLTRSLVDLARPGEPALHPIDLNAVVAEGLDLLARQLRRAGVDISVGLADDLPMVLGDTHQLQQVLINLVLNAQRAVLTDAAREPRIEISTRQARGGAELVVSDLGPGVAAEDADRVFLPFFSKAGGTGLGLPLARAIVHRHGGSLWLESPASGGATFVVHLPEVGHGRDG